MSEEQESNARIQVMTGEVISEIVSARTELRWDVLSNTGSVTFNLEKITTLDGQVISREAAGTLTHEFSTLMARTWSVPTVEGQVVEVPTTLLMATIKKAFDVLYNESANP